MPGSVPRLSPGDAVEQSLKQSLLTPPSDQARFLLEALGPRIAAVGVGLKDARQLRAWTACANEPRGAASDRLRILFRVAYAVTAVYGADTAAAFVRAANPGLDDESVLSVLRREQPSEAVEARLVGAVRDFLAA